MSHSKDHFREYALRARAALGADARAAKSGAITTLLHGWEPYRRARVLCLYASFGSEVQTGALLKDAHHAEPETVAANAAVIASPAGQPARIVCLPRVEGHELVIHRIGGAASAMAEGLGNTPAADSSGLADSKAVPHRLSDRNRTEVTEGGSRLWPGLVRSAMGMPEPSAALPVVEPRALDVILVPGSAFSVLSGHRLGYGKGFYDRLLARAPQALKVGLCFDVQLFDDEAFPTDPHDIALDVLVSESGIRFLRI